ncbi:hypothetical protein BOX15_Mlig029067g1 [Macrostomum lignano]|uniref:Uncharacterized protein n=2 Tax=Macrostomum lignano TaxID=282301 RepID=A0A267F6M2_9PLAT|nr:hypothetical protein BOX15_Mlig029067g1 [Macrostomum lignano]
MALFKAPFRTAGFFDPTRDELDNCDLDIQTPEYTREGIQLAPGCMITLAAFVLPETEHFIVDFMAPQKQIALHLRAKLNDRLLAMNSTVAGKWQSEMKVRELPLRKGRAFSMSVLVTTKAFLISYNEEHFAAFPHRMPAESVNSIGIYRGLKLAAVYYEVDYKYSPLRFTISEADSDKAAASSAASIYSAVYPQLPYRMSLEGVDKTGGGFFSAGACLLITMKPDFLAKTLNIAFTRVDGQPAVDLELYVNHSQGRVSLHSESKVTKDCSLWSLIGLNRRRHVDICVCCTDTAMRIFICHRPVFQATRDQLQSLWGRVSGLSIAGNADLIVAHFSRRG